METLDAVRLMISDKSVITRETGVGNAIDKHWKLDNAPIITSPAPEVRVNNVLLSEGVDYTINYTQGIVSFTSVPAQDDQLEFTYYWSIFSDAEIQYFIDSAGSVNIAAANALLAWAASAAKLAKRQTLSGGGGLGQVVIDTSVAAKELRATAKALVDQETELGEAEPAEGLTEIPWTEHMYGRQIAQRFVRRLD